MREFRGELRSAVAQLSASPGNSLHALYVSSVGGPFDVENVLLYNVGPSAFRRSAAFELVVERALGAGPSPPAGLTQARHHYRYETMPIDTPWRRWSAVRPLASFGLIDLGPSAQARRPSRVWYAVRRSGPEVSQPAGIPSAFGLDLILEAPANVSVNLARSPSQSWTALRRPSTRMTIPPLLATSPAVLPPSSALRWMSTFALGPEPHGNPRRPTPSLAVARRGPMEPRR